ncbi:hypothetical protein V6Z11_A10G235700 [Gossypium hirsutum]
MDGGRTLQVCGNVAAEKMLTPRGGASRRKG